MSSRLELARGPGYERLHYEPCGSAVRHLPAWHRLPAPPASYWIRPAACRWRKSFRVRQSLSACPLAATPQVPPQWRLLARHCCLLRWFLHRRSPSLSTRYRPPHIDHTKQLHSAREPKPERSAGAPLFLNGLAENLPSVLLLRVRPPPHTDSVSAQRTWLPAWTASKRPRLRLLCGFRRLAASLRYWPANRSTTVKGHAHRRLG